MRNIVWYNRSVPQPSTKKSEQIAFKVVPAVAAQLSEIAAQEDRPVGYVARELMMRGLALYQQDGQLKGGASDVSVKHAKHIKLQSEEQLRKQSNRKVR